MGRLLATICAGTLLTSCATVPSLEPGLRVPVAYLVDRFQCELHRALKQQGKRADRLRGWNAGYELTLQVDEEGGISPDISWVIPISAGTFTPGFGGGIDTTASRQVSLKFTLPVNKLLTFPCDPSLRPPSGVQLDSNLGLPDWLDRVLEAAERNAFENFDSFGTLVAFSVEASAKFTPGLELVRFKGLGSGSLKRTDTHKVNIVFSVPEEKKPGKGVSTTSRGEIDRALQRQDLQFLLPRTFRLR